MQVQKYKKSILSCFLFLVIITINFQHFFQVLEYGNYWYYLFGLTTALMGVLFLTLVFFKIKKIENKFLIIFSFLSLLYLFIVPFNYNPDEITHFMRSSEIATGQLVSKTSDNGKIGRYDSVSLKQTTEFNGYKDYYSKITKQKSEEQIFYKYPTSAVYPFVVYIPQAIGIAVANLLGLSALMMVFFGKFFNLAFFIFFAYMGLKYMPKYKTFCLSILLFPMTVQVATALSADGAIISLSFFFVALIMKIREENKISRLEKIIIPAIVMFLTLAKIAYLPIVLIILLIPKDVFNHRKERNIYVGVMLILVAVINIVWMKFAMTNYLSEGIREGVDSAKQLEFVVHNFIAYIKIFIDTMFLNFDFYIQTMTQADLVTNIAKPRIYCYFMFYCMWITLIFTKDKFKISKKLKTIALISFLLCCGCIFTSLYMQWTPYQGTVIEGVQGRYFTPILFLLPMMIFSLNFKKDFIKTNFILISFSLINILSISSYLVYYISKF